MELHNDPPARDYTRLSAVEIEKVFLQTVIDLKEILVLDGIDIKDTGFTVKCHDLHGPLPEIALQNSGDTLVDKDRLARESCKLLAIVGLRDQIVTWPLGNRFFPPTSIDGKAVVGLQARPTAPFVEGKDLLEAYHELHSQTVG